MRYLTTVLALCAMALPVTSRHACAADQTASPPYPPSPVIAGVTFDQSTWIKAAPGSDQFGTTWAADDNLYLAWGDGGGFGGTNSVLLFGHFEA